MSVYQLAGPVQIKGIPPPDYNFPVWFQYYYPRRGILLMSGWQTTIVSFDGVCTGRLTQIYPRGWWPQQQKMLLYNGTEYVVEPRVLAVQTSGEFPYAPGLPFIFANGTYVRLKDRRVWYTDGRVHGTWPDGSNIPEGPYLRFGGAAPLFQEGRSRTEVFISGGVPGVGIAGVFYDTETRELASPYYFVPASDPPVLLLMYAPEWGFMISGHGASGHGNFYAGPFSLRFWSLEVQPAKITKPLPLSPVRQGHVIRYQVKVTGNHDDPAVGELVDWTLVSGGGNLLDVQSKADANGYAETRVQYPVTMIDDPDQQKTLLMASVLC